MWRKAKLSPAEGRMRSFRTSRSTSESLSDARSGPRAAIPAARNDRPNTAPSCKDRRSGGSRRSSRARMVAWIVSGSVARSTAATSLSEWTRSLMDWTISPAKKGLPSARATTRSTICGAVGPTAWRTSCATESSLGLQGHGDVVPPASPHAGRRSQLLDG